MKFNMKKILKCSIYQIRRLSNIIFPLFLVLFVIQFTEHNIDKIPASLRMIIMIAALFKIAQILGLDEAFEQIIDSMKNKRG